MRLDFDDLRATYKELVSDVDHSKGLTKCLDTDTGSENFIKRTYTRAFFAMVEGIIAQLKQLAIQANTESRVFKVFELELLKEQAGSLDSNDGTAKAGKAKLSLLPNLQFSMTSAARALKLDFKLKKDGQGWSAMKDSIKIRDRITHPKNTECLMISGDDLKALGLANQWFRDEAVRLIDLIRGSQETNPLEQPVGLLVPDWKPPALPSRDTMEGAFCRLEALDPARHAHELHEANSLNADGRNWTYLPYGPFATSEDYFGWLSESASKSDPLFFAIIDTAHGKAVGVASYLRIDPRHGSIEVGHLNFSPLLQQKSAATEAMYLMMDRAFGLGYRRYEWKCNALNELSRRAAQRLGLSFEGVFRQAAVYKGRNRDTAWYAAIDQEWPALQNVFSRWLDPANFDEHGQQRVSLSTLTAPLLKQRG